MRLKQLITLLSVLFLQATLLLGQVSAAERVVEREMPVADRGSSERIKASIRGLFDVAGEADKYLQGYRYITRGNQLYLKLMFDRDAIVGRVEQELRATSVSQQVVMSREPLLLWLAVSQGELEALLTEGATGSLPQTILDLAAANNQPLLFPSDEVITNGEIQVSQLRRGQVGPILRASKNYGIDRVLMGSVVLVEGHTWSATWQIPGTGRQWRSRPGELNDVLAQGIQGYQQLTQDTVQADSRGYGIGDNEVSLSFGGVGNMGDFIWLRERLQGMLGEDQVRSVLVGGGSAMFAVNAGASVSAIRNRLQSERRFSELATPLGMEGAKLADISYLLN